ncbi:hypothetical protein [Salinispira pacifica]|uniref:GGDEF domain-containing protein n=1 Tax=Salinispira pacifica TaxID=1307761 RepID=V5WGS9_9SPIO|nr:hypothetical protein [Salinispira pacifica]AHC15007.1 hypothetical protein L21SP2_1622 [Salinispira pacifica]
MSSRLHKIFTSITILFFITILTFFIIMLSAIRLNNIQSVEEQMKRDIDVVAADGGSRERILQRLMSPQGTSKLKLAAIYSPDRGLYGLWSVSPSYVEELPGDPASLRGTPLFTYNGIYEELVELPIPGYSGEKAAVIYQVLSARDLRPIVENLLYMISGYALFIVIFLFISISIDRNGKEQSFEYSGATVQEGAPEPETPEPGERNAGKSGAAEYSERARSDQQSGNARSHRQKNDKDFSAGENEIWPSDLMKLRLNNEIERSAENESDIGFAVFRLHKKLVSDTQALSLFEKELLKSFRYEDLIFHIQNGYYGIILPNQNQDECVKQIERFQRVCDSESINTENVFIGLSTRSGRLMSGDRLMKEGIRAASMANPGNGGFIQFKADPRKYRAHLSGTPG